MAKYNDYLRICKDTNRTWQPVYSSQLYGTFFTIYAKFKCKTIRIGHKIILKNVVFKIVNYKGVVNLGIKNVEFHRHKKYDNRIHFRVYLQMACCDTVKGMKVEPNMQLLYDESPVVYIDRILCPFDKNSKKVFDTEFRYRDSESFVRKAWKHYIESEFYQYKMGFDEFRTVWGMYEIVGKPCIRSEMKVLP